MQVRKCFRHINCLLKKNVNTAIWRYSLQKEKMYINITFDMHLMSTEKARNY